MLIKIKELCERLFPNIIAGEAPNKPQLQAREQISDPKAEHRLSPGDQERISIKVSKR
jgi:hypothetical protein